jgi:hypothetical protein
MSYRSNFELKFISKNNGEAFKFKSDIYIGLELYKVIINNGSFNTNINCVVPLEYKSDEIPILCYKFKLFF